MYSDFRSAQKICQIKEGFHNGTFLHQKKPGKTRSKVWLKFDEIFSTDPRQKIDYFYYCTECTAVIDNLCIDGNTNRLIRHVCFENMQCETGESKQMIISKEDKEKLKLASVHFISKDLRPYYAIQCEGLLDLCYACMQFGQRYRKAQRDDLIKALPTRNTVKDTVTAMADKKRTLIAELMKRAIVSGGIAATTDTWTDDYRHITYICVVAHICIKENDLVSYHRIVLNTSEISDFVKSGI